MEDAGKDNVAWCTAGCEKVAAEVSQDTAQIRSDGSEKCWEGDLHEDTIDGEEHEKRSQVLELNSVFSCRYCGIIGTKQTPFASPSCGKMPIVLMPSYPCQLCHHHGQQAMHVSRCVDDGMVV